MTTPGCHPLSQLDANSVHTLRVFRSAHTPAVMLDAAGEHHRLPTASAEAFTPQLRRELFAQLNAPYNPRWLDVQVLHGYPPRAQLLDRAGNLPDDITMQLVRALLLGVTQATDNPGLSPEGRS